MCCLANVPLFGSDEHDRSLGLDPVLRESHKGVALTDATRQHDPRSVDSQTPSKREIALLPRNHGDVDGVWRTHTARGLQRLIHFTQRVFMCAHAA